MHQILITGARLVAAPVLTAALVVAGVTGLVLGPRALPASDGPSTAPVVVTGDVSSAVR